MAVRGRRIALAAAAVVTLFCLTAAGARAHDLLPSHELDCSRDFPCPPEIQPRMNFWIEVFRSWGRHTAVLHDSAEPQRVYEIVTNRDGCRKKTAKLKRARNRVKNSLLGIAQKMRSGAPISGEYETHLAAMFAPGDAREVRAAAGRVRCQGGGRDNFLAGLSRYYGYRPMIESVLAENDLSLDIGYLPFVESSYNPAAYSRAGAAGMWQIMPRTARVLGLKLTGTVDERLDPEAATRAAAKYLLRADSVLSETAAEYAARKPGGEKTRIDRAQLNPFIITSYNYGINGMRRAMRDVRPDYMEVLKRYKSPRFRVAVKNFYASFLAARHLAVNAEREFGEVRIAPETAYQTVVLPRAVSIERVVKVFGVSKKELRKRNRALTRFVWRGLRMVPAGYHLRLPPKEDFWHAERAFLATLPAEETPAAAGQYRVRRGDTACGIARALRVKCRDLLALNNLSRRTLIYPGQKLHIPGARKTTVAAAAGAESFYIVRRGDSACKIAQRFGVNCRKFLRHNNLRGRARIYPGQKLQLPGVGASVTEVASQNAGGENATANLANQNTTAGGDANATSPSQTAPAENANADAVGLGVTVAYQNANGNANGNSNIADDAVADDFATEFYDEFDFDFALEQRGEAGTLTAAALLNILDTLPDLSARKTNSGDSVIYTVRVEAEETLGHYADWLGLSGTAPLRKLNRVRRDGRVALGRWLRLPIRDAEMAARFERQRSDYHQVLSESLKDHYDFVGVQIYTVQSGDSPWQLARTHGFPVWLFYRLNPAARGAHLALGQLLILPKLKQKI